MIYIAAVTPRGGQGDIDVGAAFELIDYLCSSLKGRNGGIVLFDAAGEYPALSLSDRSRLLYLAVKRSRVPVWAGVGSATLDASLELAGEARDAGAAAVLVPPPYFFAHEQDEIREFYLQFAEHLDGRIYLEHLPRLVSGIEPETARELLATGRFAGIVDSTGEHAAAGDEAILANDSLLAAAPCKRPAISAAACAIPETVLALDGAIGSGNSAEIERLSARLREFLSWMDALPPSALLRVAVGLRGIKVGPLAMPLPPEKQKRMSEFREWFAKWK